MIKSVKLNYNKNKIKIALNLKYKTMKNTIQECFILKTILSSEIALINSNLNNIK